MLSRIARIFEQLNTAWDVLRTMTPSEYTEFRDQLGQSSGFQSYQYRAIEFLAGNRNLALLGPHAHRADIMAKLEEILAEPSLYDEALLLLARNGFDIGEDARRTDWRDRRTPNDEVLERLEDRLCVAGETLDALRAGGEAGRFRRLFPPLALQPRHDGRAHHRPEARHRRHGGRLLLCARCSRSNFFRNCGN